MPTILIGFDGFDLVIVLGVAAVFVDFAVTVVRNWKAFWESQRD